MGEYVWLPILPVIIVAPRLSNAPAPVNNAKLEVVPKVGATATGCPKVTFDIKNKITAVSITSNLLFILIRFNYDIFMRIKGRPGKGEKRYTKS